MADPNWFYSSLAQAAAAIVGLVGAIFGSRIIDHLALMREERNELDRRIATVYAQVQRNIDHWTEFRAFLESELREDIAAIDRGESRRRRSRMLDWDRSGSGGEVADVQGDRCEVEAKLQVMRTVLPAYRPLTGAFSDQDIVAYAQCLREYAKNAPEPQPRGILVGDAETLEGLVANCILPFRTKLLPRAFWVVFVVLIWTSLAGIIWPLSALPGLPGAYSKFWVLAAFALGLFGLLGYFGYQLFELRQLGLLYWVRIRPEDQEPRRQATARTLRV